MDVLVRRNAVQGGGEKRSKMTRLQAGADFWNEIDRHRMKGESYRAFGRRLGINFNNFFSWKRGETPRPQTVMQLVEALGLPKSEYYRLMGLLVPEAPPPPPLLDTVPLYVDNVMCSPHEGRLVSEEREEIAVPDRVLAEARASSSVIAVKCDRTADSMEPVIPRGSVVLVDTADGKTLSSLRYGAIYLVTLDMEGELALKYVVRKGDDVWMCSANQDYKPIKAWTIDPRLLIVGRVFHIQRTIEPDEKMMKVIERQIDEAAELEAPIGRKKRNGRKVIKK